MKADHSRVTRLLKTARGQIDGILKMVEEDRYCIDISNQVMATESILARINQEILRAHLQSCVMDAFQSGNEQKAEEKIDEVMSVLQKMNK